MTELHLVTGATGFVGRHVVNALLDRGERVRVFARDASRLPETWRGRVEVAVGDLTAPESLAPAVKEVGIIHHIAGVINLPPGQEATFFRINLDGTKLLFEAAAKSGAPLKRFLYCSSVGVMGILGKVPADETTPCRPTNAYERSKHEAETWVLEEGRRRGIPVSVARPAWVYGPGDRRTFPIFSMIAKRHFVMIGKGETWIHPVYVEDVAEGILACVRSDATLGEKVILAGEAPVRLKDLVSLLSGLLGVKPLPFRVPAPVATLIAMGCEILYTPLRKQPPLHRRRLGFFLRDQAFDIGRARALCGYRPSMDLREGMRRAVAWYRVQGWL